MSKKGRVVYSRITEVANPETGEVKIAQKDNVVRMPTEPPYVKMYIEDLGNILGLTTGCKNLVYCLVHSMGYDGVVSITKGKREKFAESIGVKEGVIKNQITKLCKSGAIKRIATGDYEMNPNYFAKGDWPEIRKRQNDFKLSVKYKNGKREITGKAI